VQEEEKVRENYPDTPPPHRKEEIQRRVHQLSRSSYNTCLDQATRLTKPGTKHCCSHACPFLQTLIGLERELAVLGGAVAALPTAGTACHVIIKCDCMKVRGWVKNFRMFSVWMPG